jgi:hypothetical protein
MAILLGLSGPQECFLAPHPFVLATSGAAPDLRMRQGTNAPSLSLNHPLWARGGAKGARRATSTATVGVSTGWAPR